MRGIALKERTDPKAAAHLSLWLQKLRQDHAARILPVTDRIAVEWGRLAALRPRGGADVRQLPKSMGKCPTCPSPAPSARRGPAGRRGDQHLSRRAGPDANCRGGNDGGRGAFVQRVEGGIGGGHAQSFEGWVW